MKDSVSSTVLVLRTVLGMVCASTVTAILFLEVFTGIDLHPSMIIEMDIAWDWELQHFCTTVTITFQLLCHRIMEKKGYFFTIQFVR